MSIRTKRIDFLFWAHTMYPYDFLSFSGYYEKQGEHAGSPLRVYAPSPLHGEGWGEGDFPIVEKSDQKSPTLKKADFSV